MVLLGLPLCLSSSSVGSPEAESLNTTGIGVGVLVADDGLEEGTSSTPFLNNSPMLCSDDLGLPSPVVP